MAKVEILISTNRKEISKQFIAEARNIYNIYIRNLIATMNGSYKKWIILCKYKWR
jgi:hypothetical protein